jgi:hypothetical protein
MILRGSCIALLLTAASCATVEQHNASSRAIGSDGFVSVGDVVLRVEVTEDLPNAFGRADVFGRNRNRGFSEVRYMGVNSSGYAVFRTRDVDVVTNENTMNRTGLRTATVLAEPSGNGVVASGVGTQTPPPSVQVVDPDTVEFTLDLSRGNVVTMRDRTILVHEATNNGVRFTVR